MDSGQPQRTDFWFMTGSYSDRGERDLEAQFARLRTLLVQRNRTILKLTSRLRPMRDRIRSLEAENARLREDLGEAQKHHGDAWRIVREAESNQRRAEQDLHMSYEELENLATEVEEHNTQLEEANAMIALVLRDNQALLAEVHHRVKNNFQTIISAIRLKLRRVEPASQGALIDVLGRVHAMALVHDLLFGQGAPSTVQPGPYLSELCQRLSDATRANFCIVVESDDIEPVDPETALSLGSIVSELVANAMKHAFLPGRAGTIRVALKGRRTWEELVVHDDGVGLSARGVNPGAGVGLSLVRTMARQIGAEITVEEKDGTSVLVRRQGRLPAGGTPVRTE